jgi:hypothetical protein
MSKFRSPFTTDELFVTQTYHGESATNPGDLSKQCAVDFSKVGGSNVLSVCPGVVDIVTASFGSYVSVIPDNAQFKILYVHVDRFEVSPGQRVQAGTVLGKVRAMTGSHLHFGLKNISGVAPHPRPMEYFDRSLVFKTNYQSIRDIWFSGNSLNWSLFKDLSYDNTIMFKKGDKIEFTGTQNIRQGSGTNFPTTGSTQIGQLATIIGGPRTADNYTWWDVRIDGGGTGWLADVGKWKIYVAPVPTPEPIPIPPPSPEPCSKCIEYQKQMTTLNNEINTLKSKLGTQGGQLDEAHREIKKLEKLFEEQEELIKEQEEEIGALTWKNAALLREKMDLVNDLNEAKRKLKEGQTNFIKQITDRLGEWLSKILGDRT